MSERLDSADVAPWAGALPDAGDAAAPAGPEPDEAAVVDGSLDRSTLLEIAVERRPVRLGDAASARIEAGNAALMRWLYEGRHVYGASSGVGDLRTSDVDVSAWERLQRNIVRSHSCGVGEALPVDVVRGAIALRLATFATGHSGIRPRMANGLTALLNREVHPVVPCTGSVGASGDPVLLAHVGSVLIGEGQARVGDGPVQPAATALAEVGLSPIGLQPREGLAMVNGLDVTTSQAVLAAERAARALEWCDAAAVLSLEAIRGSLEPFAAPVQELCGAGAHQDVAAKVRRMVAGSELVGGSETLTQDPYCVRCVPQVHGAVTDAVRHANGVLELEVASVVDNPVTFVDTETINHCGLFHGQRSALAADSVAAALSSVANIVQARISLLLRGQRGLPRMLCIDPGSQSGLMMLETMSASVVARLRMQATPLSVQNVPVSSEQEDHVSMAWEAWRRVDTMVDGLAEVVAAELIAAARACRWRAPRGPGWLARRLIEQVGPVSQPGRDDQPLSSDLERLAGAVRSSVPPAR